VLILLCQRDRRGGESSRPVGSDASPCSAAAAARYWAAAAASTSRPSQGTHVGHKLQATHASSVQVCLQGRRAEVYAHKTLRRFARTDSDTPHIPPRPRTAERLCPETATRVPTVPASIRRLLPRTGFMMPASLPLSVCAALVLARRSMHSASACSVSPRCSRPLCHDIPCPAHFQMHTILSPACHLHMQPHAQGSGPHDA